MKMGIIYGSTTGNTRQAAEKIGAIFSQAEVLSVADVNSFEDYDVMILGSSTWGLGDLQDEWDSAIGKLEASSLIGKKVALFGLGDQLGYPDTFVDAIGKLGHAAQVAGANLIGAWPAAGYDCETSEALEGDLFCGLALDEENQSRLSAERIQTWCNLIEKELAD